ncbi:MAG: hypothetical protein SH857_16185 [Chitinophagales bacterium]|nr:hypothetical protein [Chitinophagales bacterium]
MKSLKTFHPAALAQLLILAFALSAMQGCSKDELLSSYGHVRYTGAFASGGCEWIIEVPAGRYEPRNLPVDFQIDGLNVYVTYRVVQATANCPNAQNYQGLIHLNRIK